MFACVRLREAVRKLLDPTGPLGEVVSPSEVYKSRAGLPISAPHSARVALQAPGYVEQTLAPARFVTLADAVDVPRDRVRQVSAYVAERWSPVYERTRSTDMTEILRASQTQVGWEVRQERAASARARPSAEQFAEIVQTAQIQASDEFYAGYYETVPGNDPIEIDGKILTGGTRIASRTEWREKTKGMVVWDRGFWEQKQAAEAEMASRPVRNVRANLERMAGEVLPTRRLVANPRTDRTRAV